MSGAEVGECTVQVVDDYPKIIRADQRILIDGAMFQLATPHITLEPAAGTRVNIGGQVTYMLTGERDEWNGGWHATRVDTPGEDATGDV
jgi:hypothetical protein